MNELELPSGVDAWDLYKHLAGRLAETGGVVRRTLVLFFAVYLFQELLAAAQVGGVSLLGVEIQNVGLLLLLIPALLAFIVYEEFTALVHELLTAGALNELEFGPIGGGSVLLYIAARPGTIALRATSVLSGIEEAADPQSTSGRFAGRLVMFPVVVFVVLPLLQMAALIRACWIAVESSAWGWATTMAVLSVAGVALAMFMVSLMAFISEDDPLLTSNRVESHPTDEASDRADPQ